MKRTLRFLALATVLVMMLATVPVSAARQTTNPSDLDDAELVSVEYLPDGSYIETHVGEEIQGPGGIQLFATAYNKTGYKVRTGYDGSGNVNWRLYVYGTFTINPGVSSTCINDWYDSYYYSPWSQKSASSYHTTSGAAATATYVRKFLGITMETNNVGVSILCDKNGNLS